VAKETHVHDFGGGLTCRVTVNPTRLFQGKSHVVACEWSRKPTMEIVVMYRDWMHGINTAMADRVKMRILYLFQVGERVWEQWVYIPGEPPAFAGLL
jgi:hypothetical protein